MSVLNNEEDTLKYTQTERLRVIGALGGNPEFLVDPKMAAVLLKALDGVDKQVLTLKRLNIEQQSADNDKEVALLLAQASERRAREQSNPFRSTTTPTAIPTTEDVILGNHEFTEEELSDNVNKQTADKFLNKYREDNGLVKSDA